jgi:hypothetical protein
MSELEVKVPETRSTCSRHQHQLHPVQLLHNPIKLHTSHVNNLQYASFTWVRRRAKCSSTPSTNTADKTVSPAACPSTSSIVRSTSATSPTASTSSWTIEESRPLWPDGQYCCVSYNPPVTRTQQRSPFAYISIIQWRRSRLLDRPRPWWLLRRWQLSGSSTRRSCRPTPCSSRQWCLCRQSELPATAGLSDGYHQLPAVHGSESGQLDDMRMVSYVYLWVKGFQCLKHLLTLFPIALSGSVEGLSAGG